MQARACDRGLDLARLGRRGGLRKLIGAAVKTQRCGVVAQRICSVTRGKQRIDIARILGQLPQGRVQSLARAGRGGLDHGVRYADRRGRRIGRLLWRGAHRTGQRHHRHSQRATQAGCPPGAQHFVKHSQYRTIL